MINFNTWPINYKDNLLNEVGYSNIQTWVTSQLKIGKNEPKNQESVAPSEDSHEIQPEEEPNQQISVNLQHVNDRLAQAHGTPVPDTPMSSVPEDAAAEGTSEHSPTTASLETDDEVNDTDQNMEPVYNATLLENGILVI